MTELTIEISTLLTLSKSAKVLKVSRPTLYNLIKRNHLHPVVIGKNRYLLKAEVERLKAERG